jgi:hypothetical protein
MNQFPLADEPHQTAGSVVLATNQMPDDLTSLWDGLDLRDPAMVLCLESVVRSVRADGTALVADVARRFVDQQRKAHGNGVADVAGTLVITLDLGTERIESLLYGLSGSGLIALPKPALSDPGATVKVQHPLLRRALIEAGVMRAEAGRNVPELASAAPLPQRQITSVPKASAASRDEWAQLWFAAQRFDWSALAVVPASDGGDGLEAAGELVASGRLYETDELELIDATGIKPDSVERVLTQIDAALARAARVVIGLDNPLANPSAIPIVRHTGTALLAVRLGVPTMRDTERTLDVIGRHCFIGSVALQSRT